MRFKYIIQSLMLLVSVSLLATPKLNVKPIDASADPNEEIKSLQTAIDSAKNDQLDLLAPQWFTNATESLANAVKYRDKRSDTKTIFHELELGHAQIEQAQMYAKITRDNLKDVIKAREDAIKANAEKMKQEFMAAQERFIALVKDVENEKLDKAKRVEPDVVKVFRDLELKAIQSGALKTAKDNLAKAQAEGAKKIVEKAFVEAETKVKDAEAVIVKDRYDAAAIEKASAEALFFATRALNLNRAAKSMASAKPGDIAMRFESTLADIAQEIVKNDIRDKELMEQKKVITEAIAELVKAYEAAKAGLGAQEAETAASKQQQEETKAQLEEVKRKEQALAAEKAYSELFDKAGTFFAAGEAEIFRKEGKLVIRLVSFHFPINKAVISPENFTLLSKVKQAIEIFGQPKVNVEGHTDSIEAKKLSVKLSEQRANAVAQYLKENKATLPEKISAVGKGKSEPVAANDTKEGRAKNRRVDIIIDPSN